MTPFHPLVVRRVLDFPGALKDIQITSREDAGPVRLITHGRQHKVVGSFYSVKKGASVPWESRAELHDIYRAEVSGEVLTYQAQPETLHFKKDGTSYRYTPDRMDVLVNGTKRYVEVKGDLRDERRPDYAEKIELVGSIYQGLGCCFEIVERSYIEREPSFSAIKEIQAFRRAAVTAHHVLEIQRRLAGGGVPWVDLVAHLGDHGHQILCAMIVRRIIFADLEAGLTPSTMVRLADKRGGFHEW